MLPKIDPTTPPPSAGSNPQARRPELDQALEAYKAPQVREQAVQEQAAETRSTTDIIQKAQRTSDARSVSGRAPRDRDSAEINFQMTREERAVFVNAMSGKEDPADMTEEEQGTLQKVSERIEKLIEDAITRDTASRERVESAVKEWYSRLSNGKREPGQDLLYLIRQAAMGQLKPL